MTRIAFTTLGCKVNQYDTAAIQSLVTQSEDYTIVPFEDEADIYVVNTCTVTGKGDTESRRLIRRALRKNHKAQIIVTGCYAQTNPGEIAGMDGVSMVLGNEEKYSFMDYLKHTGEDPDGRKVFVGKISDVSFMQRPGLVAFPGRTRAFLKVQDGCDSRCSYCIVPFSRGRSRSLPPGDVLKEVSGLCRSGYQEIVLCGVHLGGYGRDLAPKTSLSSLIERILKETETPRIRLSSIEPREITDELIGLAGSEERICKHFHIPLQSGDDDILQRMNRNYDAAFYEDLICRIRGEIGDAGIGCDVMVGYPGEEESHFNQTYALIERLPLTYFHVFAYSPRQGTAAYPLGETVKGDVKRKRSDALREIGLKKGREFRSQYIGRIIDVLVEEERDEMTGLLKGYTGNYLKVLLHDNERLMLLPGTKEEENVIPAQAGIQTAGVILDSCFRRNDGHAGAFSSENPSLMNKIMRVRISGMVNDSLLGEVYRGSK